MPKVWHGFKKIMQNKKKNSLKTLILSDLLMLVCVVLLLYPIVSDIWNGYHSSYMVSEYNESVEDMSEKDYEEILAKAREYNKTLVDKGNSRFSMSDEERAYYNSLLTVKGIDTIAYVTCSKIGAKNLPVYHGTSSSVLQAGVGHYEGSSLPVGGKGTHSVLSGHTGMAGLKMFSELSKLEKGDTFTIKVLNRTLTYQVDDINEVYPDDISCLEIDPEEDYCTLITCIPIGINSQRLLVRGKRIPNKEAKLMKEDGEDKGVIGRVWEWIMARFAVYELLMALAAGLIVVVFLIPDFLKIRRRKK